MVSRLLPKTFLPTRETCGRGVEPECNGANDCSVGAGEPTRLMVSAIALDYSVTVTYSSTRAFLVSERLEFCGDSAGLVTSLIK